MARRGGSTDQTGDDGVFALSHLARHGHGRVRRTMDDSGRAQGHLLHLGGSARETAPHRLGHRRRNALGGREYIDGFRHPQRRAVRRIPAVEHQQPRRHVLGMAALQRAAGKRRETAAGRAGRRHRHCLRRMPAGVLDRESRFIRKREAAMLGILAALRRSPALGHDVYPLSQGLHQRDESAVVRHCVHRR